MIINSTYSRYRFDTSAIIKDNLVLNNTAPIQDATQLILCGAYSRIGIHAQCTNMNTQ